MRLYSPLCDSIRAIRKPTSPVLMDGQLAGGRQPFHNRIREGLPVTWARMSAARLPDGSCMSRETHVQFCEGLGCNPRGHSPRDLLPWKCRRGSRHDAAHDDQAEADGERDEDAGLRAAGREVRFLGAYHRTVLL